MIRSPLTRRLLVPCLAVVVIALGAVVSPGIVARFTPASQDATGAPGSAPVTDPLFTDYTSTDDVFRVTFPGSPHIDRLSLPVDGEQVPYTIFSASVDPHRDYRAVIVYDYSGVAVSARDLSPETALNRVVRNVPGAHLVSSGHTTLAGHNAVVGDYTALAGSQSSQSVDCLIEIIQVGTHLYGVTSAGISRASFDTFAGSFHLTQS